MTTPTCADCRFWKRKDDETYGYCRRRAPLYTTEAGGVFPDVRADEWCGEHETVAVQAARGKPFAMLCDGCGADVSEDFKANRNCSTCSNDTYVVKSPRMPLKRPTDDGKVCGSVHDFGQASGERCLLDPGHTGNHYHSPSGWVWKQKP